MRKTLGAVLAVGLCGTVFLGVSAARAASDTAGPRTPRFTVVEHADTDTVIDLGPTGDSLGDSLAFGNPVFNAGDTVQVGRDQGSCIRTVVGEAWECSWTTILRGGSLVVQGPFLDSADSTLAITGGTGIWSKARGQMRLHARNAAGTAFDFTFEIRG